MLNHPNPVKEHTQRVSMPWVVSLVVSGLWAVGYSVRGVLEYVRFHTHTFDLGIFAQGTWLLGQMKEPFVTLRGLHLFADHSSYILVLVAPLYFVFPSAGTLIVVTVVCLAVSAPLAYVIAQRAGASPRLALLSSVLVLLAPAVQWQVHAAFHPEVIVIPLCLGAIALIQRDRPLWAIVAIAVALTAKEDVGLLVVPLGLAVVFVMGRKKTGWIVVAMGSFAFVLNFFVLLPAWSPTGELLYSQRYAYLGDSPLSIAWGVASSPDVWWNTVTSGKRIGDVAALVLAMPLSFFGWRWLLIGVPTLAANVLSLHHYQYRVQSHYTAYLIVAVVLAGAFGAGRFDGLGRFTWRRPMLMATIVAPLLLWIVAAPITVWAPSHDHPARIESMLALVPEGAVVSATTTFTPHLANREQAYLFPNPWEELNYGADGVVAPDPGTVEWIAIRTDVEQDFAVLVLELIQSGAFVVVREDGPFLLLHRAAAP